MQKSGAAERSPTPTAPLAHLGGCGYEAVDACIAVPKARARTGRIIAMQPIGTGQPPMPEGFPNAYSASAIAIS